MSVIQRTVLYVNLSNNKISKEFVDSKFYRMLIGGSGVGWKLIAQYLKPEVDPLSPENVVVISPGVLVGTACPGAAKLSAITKLPIIATEKGKHFIDECTSGGRYFGSMLKRAGYDHLIITGRAEGPVYIKIFDEDVEILDASDLWGKSTYETAEILNSRESEVCGVATIGVAGENKVRYALAIIDKVNTLGRSGVGAVFGSKNLKAIVVKGSNEIRIENATYNSLIDRLQKTILKWPNRSQWIKLGMGAGWNTFIHTQYPGIWSKKKWNKLYGEQKRIETIDRITGCRSCLIPCKIIWKIRNGEYAGEVGFGSPFGKSATSGQLLGVEDHRKMVHMVRLTNEYGVDFYTATRLIDFIMKLYQKGKINKSTTKGLELTREYRTYLDILKMIVNRKGFGDLLAEGWLRLYEKLGLDPQEYWYAGICKGVDFIYDARPSRFHPLMMTFFTRPRPHHGGSHTLTNRPGLSLEEIRSQVEEWGIPGEIVRRIFTRTPYSGEFNIGLYTKYMEDQMRIKNSLGICSVYTFFNLIPGYIMADLYSAATGINLTAEELMECGERISNIAKLLNAREGFSRIEDRPPEIWFKPLISPEGRIKMTDHFETKIITRGDIDQILNDYYQERGWDIKTGIPKKEKIFQLKLQEVIPRSLLELSSE